MGRFRPDAARPRPDATRTPEQLAGLHVQRGLNDDRVVEVRPLAVSCIIHIVVDERQRRIDSVRIQPDGIGPRPFGTLGRYEEIAAAPDMGRDDVEAAARVTNRRRVNPAGRAYAVQIELALSGKDVTDRPPVNEIAAMKNRDARKVLEAARDQVKVGSDPAHARVRVESGDDGVRERRHGDCAGKDAHAAWTSTTILIVLGSSRSS